MAWSSFAHLPTSEDEYWYILSKLNNGMTIHDVDNIIASQKGKEKVPHHYRGNLAKMGFFKIDHNCITLNYNINKLLADKSYLKFIFIKVLKQNKSFEVNEVYKTVNLVKLYDLRKIIDELSLKYPLIDYNSLLRWIRPLVAIIKFAEVLDSNTMKDTSIHLQNAYFLQEAYLKEANAFSEVVALETLEMKLKLIQPNLKLLKVIENILDDNSMKFKIELLTMPSWAADNKSYILYNNVYTHIKIKSDLTEEDNGEKENTTK